MFGPLAKLALLILGSVYPGYRSFKALAKFKAKPDSVKKWLVYWMVYGICTSLFFIPDILIGWFPLYDEAKCFFVVYLWHTKTQGALFIYETYVGPFLVRNEPLIDQRANGLKSKGVYSAKATEFLMTKLQPLIMGVLTGSMNAPAPGTKGTPKKQKSFFAKAQKKSID